MARHTNSRRDRLRYPNQQYPGTQSPTYRRGRPRASPEDFAHVGNPLCLQVIWRGAEYVVVAASGERCSKWSPRLERKRRVQLYNPRLKVNGRTMNTRRRGSGGFGNLDLSGTARTIFNPHKLF
ncbi:hypothetical protein PoMZ_09365, partial [Pyricularia oryzae]